MISFFFFMGAILAVSGLILVARTSVLLKPDFVATVFFIELSRVVDVLSARGISNLKPRSHRRFLSRNSTEFLSRSEFQLHNRACKPPAILSPRYHRSLVSNMFETCCNSERDKNCIELRDKNCLFR